MRYFIPPPPIVAQLGKLPTMDASTNVVSHFIVRMDDLREVGELPPECKQVGRGGNSSPCTLSTAEQWQIPASDDCAPC